MLIHLLVAGLSWSEGHRWFLINRLPDRGGGHATGKELGLLFIRVIVNIVVIVLRLHFSIVLLGVISVLVVSLHVLVVVYGIVVTLVVILLVDRIASGVLGGWAFLHVRREEKVFRHSLGYWIYHISQLILPMSEAAHSGKFADA